MRNKVGYEWDMETWEGMDVVDHHHSDKLDFLNLPRAVPNEHGKHEVLVLVRDLWNCEDGLVDRTWAYVQSGTLPATFDDGTKVPKRFHAEYNRWVKKMDNKL